MHGIERPLGSERPGQGLAEEAAAGEVAVQEEDRRPRAPGVERQQRRLRAQSLVAHRQRELLERRVREQHGERDLDAELRLDPVDHPRREQRVATEVEEVVARADVPDAEQLLPDHRHQALRRVRRRVVPADPALGEVLRVRQLAAIDLAVGGERHRRKEDERPGDHVLGQRAPQVAPERLRVGRTARRRDHVRGQAPVVAGGAVQHDDGFRDLRQARERGLDLARLDPVPAQLDLPVDAPEELDRAVAATPGEVAGAVEPRRGIVDERVRHEARRGLAGRVEVARGHAGAADVDLARHVEGHRLQMPVEDVDPGVGDRASDRYRRRALGHRADLVERRERRRLGRTVDVQQPLRRAVGEHRGDPARFGGLPAEQHVAAVAKRGRRIAGDLVEQRRGQEQRGDAEPLDRRGEAGRRQRDLARHDDQPRAVEQRAPDLEGRGVECRIRDLGDDLVRSQLHVVRAADEVRDGLLPDQHALRHAGGPRRVHHVRDVHGARRRRRVGHRPRIERRPVAIDADRGDPRRRQARQQLQVGDDHRDVRVAQQQREALGGQRGIERHVGGARLHRGERGDDEVLATLEAHADPGRRTGRAARPARARAGWRAR